MLLAADFGDDVYYDFDLRTKATFIEGEDGRAYISNPTRGVFSLDGNVQPLWGGVPLKHVRSYAYILYNFSPTGKVNREQFGVLSWRRFCKGPTCYTREKYISYYNEFSIPTIRENWNEASTVMSDATEATAKGVATIVTYGLTRYGLPYQIPYVGGVLFVADMAKLISTATTKEQVITYRQIDLSTAPRDWR